MRKNICSQWILEPDYFWENIIFSDECKFNLYNSDGCSYVWRESNKRFDSKYIQPTVKFGKGNLMVWGCISSKGLGKIVFIGDTMNSQGYLDILKNNLKNSAVFMGLDNFIFQHDNDPKHASGIIKRFFDEKKIDVLPWPSQSPDLNPIEHVLAYMKIKLRGKNFEKKDHLKAEIIKIWNEIPNELLVKNISSMPKRVKQVLDSNGKWIKY